MSEPTTIKTPLPDVFTKAAEPGCYPNPDCAPYAEGDGGDYHPKTGEPPRNVRRGNEGPKASSVPGPSTDPMHREPGCYPGDDVTPYANETRNLP